MCKSKPTPESEVFPFHGEIEWKQKIYVLCYMYFSYHNTIYKPYADIATQSRDTPSFVSHSCHHRTQEHEQDKKRDPITAFCIGNTEETL